MIRSESIPTGIMSRGGICLPVTPVAGTQFQTAWMNVKRRPCVHSCHSRVGLLCGLNSQHCDWPPNTLTPSPHITHVT